MATEVEAKFRADTAEPLVDLATRASLGSATLGPARVVDEVDRYLDTADGRLAAARWACRLRSREGVTQISLKGPPMTPATGWQHRRPEIEGPATDAIDRDAWPPSAARDLLDELSGAEPLVERLRLLQSRTERLVTTDGAPALATLTLDRVRIEAGGRDLGRLYVVELELGASTAEDEAALAVLAAELGSVPGLVEEPRSKFEHALARLAQRG